MNETNAHEKQPSANADLALMAQKLDTLHSDFLLFAWRSE